MRRFPQIRWPALIAILAIVLQGLVPAAAIAHDHAQTIEICTPQGLKLASIPADPGHGGHFGGLGCEQCVLASFAALAPAPPATPRPLAWTFAPPPAPVPAATPLKPRPPPRPPSRAPPILA